jgi:hypothetical protein
MVEIANERIRSIGRWLEDLSPQTADALKNYTKDPQLFEWQKFVKADG